MVNITVIDVETVGSPQVELLMDPVRAPAHYKDPFKIQTYIMDKVAERVATASLEPDLCEIVAIGIGQDDQTEAMTRAELQEWQLLDYFWDRVKGNRMLGFNILQFDLPVLMRRSQLLGIPFPPVNIDRYRTSHIDLLDKLSFQGRIQYRSLNFYTRRFDIECPEDPVKGEDVPRLVAEGEWTAICQHVFRDVEKTRLLGRRLGYLTPEIVVTP